MISMKKQFFLTVFLLHSSLAFPQPSTAVITTDIGHFWEAYDKITSTQDSALQYQYLQELYLDRGTPGLEAIRQARRYTPESYIEAIHNYPLFWPSIRENTLKAAGFAEEIQAGIESLKQIYPELKPANVYFCVGAFRTPGTTMDGRVLIGVELAMGDEHTEGSEFSGRMQYVADYFKSNPINDLAFLNIHEFVHTQQVEAIGSNLISQCLREGVAEFIAELASGQASTAPAIAFGKENNAAVRKRFSEEMFAYSYHNWLWNDRNNDFGLRDLGYYVGYAIAERFYKAATDKQMAIKNMIELDYRDEDIVNQFVDDTGYFTSTLATLKEAFEENRPSVLSISPFENNREEVHPGMHKITIHFSSPMDKRFRGFDYGPLGEEQVLSVQRFLGFSDDGRSVSFEVKTEPNRRYQLLLTESFIDETGRPLQPYLIDIKTSR